MKRRTLLALLLSPIVSPLLGKSGACSRKTDKEFWEDYMGVDLSDRESLMDKPFLDGPFKTESAFADLYHIPQEYLDTEDYKDLIENEKKVVK